MAEPANNRKRYFYALGSEMLISNIHKQDGEEVLKYDGGAIFLVFLLTCFSVGMGMIEWFISYAEYMYL